MKVKLVSFTNYKLDIDVYSKSDIDFFSYLLLDLIIKRDDHILLDELRKGLDIPDKLSYLFENSFYNLIDNNLIRVERDVYLECYLDDIVLTKLGEECHKNKILYTYLDNEYKEINISPIDNSIAPLEKKSLKGYGIVLSKVNDKDDVEKILNENIKRVFPTYKDVRIVVNKMEADYYEEECEFKNNDEFLINYGLKDNLVYYDCDSKDFDDKYELSLVSMNVKNIDYYSSKYSFEGMIDNVKYGFDYCVVDNIPYLRKEKIK